MGKFAPLELFASGVNKLPRSAATAPSFKGALGLKTCTGTLSPSPLRTLFFVLTVNPMTIDKAAKADVRHLIPTMKSDFSPMCRG